LVVELEVDEDQQKDPTKYAPWGRSCSDERRARGVK
jgi:hypothetical protein